MFIRRPYNPGPYDDDFEDAPPGYAWQTWGLGLFTALALFGVGVRTIVTRSINFNGSRGSEHLNGGTAVAVGVPVIGAALLLFCHYFIQNWRPMAWYAVAGKIVGLLAIIGGLGVYVAASFQTFAASMR